MSTKTWIIFVTLGLLTTLNAIALVVNLPQPSRAAVHETSYQDLMHDADFTRAVESIAEQCSVNVDLGKLKCQGG